MLLDRYQLIKGYGNKGIISVGFGSYGQVKLARDKKTGHNVAVKIVHKASKTQIAVHQELFHPNIIKLIDYVIDKGKDCTYMILQYADGGTLFEKIQNQSLTKKQIKTYFKDVCQALAYMHKNDIMHRDIKPQNILLTKKGRAKICDFGFAAILGQRKTLCGTYEYMAPQMIQNKSYDYKVDVWALGILLFQMIAGEPPFRGTSPQEVLNQMKTTIFFSQNFTNQQINLIKSILRVATQKRPTIKQILNNPYFYEENSISTKESLDKQIKSRNSKEMNKNFVTNPEIQQYQHNNMQMNTPMMFKHQQNSYPFYTPKTQLQSQINAPHTYTAFYVAKTQQQPSQPPPPPPPPTQPQPPKIQKLPQKPQQKLPQKLPQKPYKILSSKQKPLQSSTYKSQMFYFQQNQKTNNMSLQNLNFNQVGGGYTPYSNNVANSVIFDMQPQNQTNSQKLNSSFSNLHNGRKKN